MLAAFVGAILRCFTGLLLLAAAIGKLRKFREFRHNLAGSLGLGAAVSQALAPALVAAELAVAAMVLGPARQAGMLLALLLFALFTAFISYKYFTQPGVRCSCFGGAARPVSSHDLQRNVLVILAILGYLALPGAAALGWPALALAAALSAFLCVAAIGFHDIAVLLKH